jgi:signal transduction histidine kinase
MAAGIAHEINNPLAGILLFSSRMRKKVTEEGPIKEGLDVIVQETQRCKGIIQDLLEFSRDKEPEKAESSINDIIEKALSILENELHLHHISVEKNLSGDIPLISLDVNLMQQVFVNLLINAVEAIQENGVIRIQSYVNPNRKTVGVGVVDTGGGIPPDDMVKIFEPFFSTKKNGTGLGLAVSYGIVQKHGGNVQVSSRLGEGTQFTVEIPLSN